MYFSTLASYIHPLDSGRLNPPFTLCPNPHCDVAKTRSGFYYKHNLGRDFIIRCLGKLTVRGWIPRDGLSWIFDGGGSRVASRFRSTEKSPREGPGVVRSGEKRQTEPELHVQLAWHQFYLKLDIFQSINSAFIVCWVQPTPRDPKTLLSLFLISKKKKIFRFFVFPPQWRSCLSL